MGIQNWQLKSAQENIPDSIAAADHALEVNSIQNTEFNHPAIVADQHRPDTQVKDAPDVNVAQAVADEANTINSQTHDVGNLLEKITRCRKCASRKTRLNALPGQGNIDASLVIIGGAPGAEEDRLGHYFSAQAETLFSAMLESIKQSQDYYYTSLLKCYSLSDFVITKEHFSNCADYLYTQIEQIRPTALLVLGAAEAQLLLATEQSFNELRGDIHQLTIHNNNYPLVVSYHPNYLLRNPAYKKHSMNDLIRLKKILND